MARPNSRTSNAHAAAAASQPGAIRSASMRTAGAAAGDSEAFMPVQPLKGQPPRGETLPRNRWRVTSKLALEELPSAGSSNSRLRLAVLYRNCVLELAKRSEREGLANALPKLSYGH